LYIQASIIRREIKSNNYQIAADACGIQLQFYFDIYNHIYEHILKIMGNQTVDGPH